MKKKLFFLFVLFCLFTIPSFSEEIYSEPDQATMVPYRLYKTSNMWNFIQLETSTGKMYIVQYSINDDYRGRYPLNDKNLASEKKSVIGRFTLYPTSNIWNFILLDQIDVIHGKFNGL